MSVPPEPAEFVAEVTEFVDIGRPVVEQVAERGEQPPRTETSGGRTSASARGPRRWRPPTRAMRARRRPQITDVCPAHPEDARAPPRCRRPRRPTRRDRSMRSATAPPDLSQSRSTSSSSVSAPGTGHDLAPVVGEVGPRKLGARCRGTSPGRTRAPTAASPGDVEHRRKFDDVHGLDRFAADGPFVCDERRARARLEVRRPGHPTNGVGRRPRSAGRS